MNEYALFINGTFEYIKRFEEIPVNIPHKNVEWFPVVRETVDNSTQNYKTTTTESVLEQGNYVIRTTISDMTPAEIAAAQENKRNLVVNVMDEDFSVFKAIALTLFDLTNEVRILKGQQTITLQQFKDYVRSKL